MTTTAEPECCDLHIDGVTGTCCDPDDCGPCCGGCPTCPTLHNMTRSGPAYSRRRRDERGAGVLSSLVVVIALFVAVRLISDAYDLSLDPIGWLSAAVDWGVGVARDVGRMIGGQK